MPPKRKANSVNTSLRKHVFATIKYLIDQFIILLSKQMGANLAVFSLIQYGANVYKKSTDGSILFPLYLGF
jgi:hypothetical protein